MSVSCLDDSGRGRGADVHGLQVAAKGHNAQAHTVPSPPAYQRSESG